MQPVKRFSVGKNVTLDHLWRQKLELDAVHEVQDLLPLHLIHFLSTGNNVLDKLQDVRLSGVICLFITQQLSKRLHRKINGITVPYKRCHSRQNIVMDAVGKCSEWIEFRQDLELEAVAVVQVLLHIFLT